MICITHFLCVCMLGILVLYIYEFAQISNNKHTYICPKSKSLQNKDLCVCHNYKTTKDDLTIHCQC